MEYEYHELSYMKVSLELVEVKEEIEHLMKEKYALDQKLERKSREQNELTEKCMRHIRVLKRKGMTGDFYCPKKWGVMVTPTKTGASSYAPNYIPSPRSYAPNYIPSLKAGTLLKAKSGICLHRGVFGHPFILDNWPKLHQGVVLPGFLCFIPWVDYQTVSYPQALHRSLPKFILGHMLSYAMDHKTGMTKNV